MVEYYCTRNNNDIMDVYTFWNIILELTNMVVVRDIYTADELRNINFDFMKIRGI